MVLSDIDIKALIGVGDLVISPPPGKIDPASIDLRVGEEGWGRVEGSWLTRFGVLRQPQRINIAENRIIRFPRGSITVISTFETIKLSKKITGTYGLRSRYAREGLILLSGPQIAPGFEGRLTATIFNAGTREFELSYKEPFATLVLFKLETPASDAYRGRYQNQLTVSPEEVKAATRRHLSFDQVESELNKLRIQYQMMSYLFLAVVAGAIAGMLYAWVPALKSTSSVSV